MIENFGNKKNSKPFNKGEDKRRNKKGANKGSKWRKSLLKDILTLELSDTETDQFNYIKSLYPRFFEGTEVENLQLFLELKQIQLVFSDDERVAQTAIKEVKDRIDGKSEQTTKMDMTTNGNDINAINYDNLTLDELLTLKKLNEKAKNDK